MKNPRPPSEPESWDSSSEEETKSSSKRPEFVILEDDRIDEEKKRDEDSYYQTILKLRDVKFGLAGRLMAAILFCFLGLVTLFFSFIFVFCLICLLVTFGRVPTVIDLWRRALTLYGKLILYTLACLIGIFSPRWGICMGLLYHILHREKLEGDMFSRVAEGNIHFN